jgi:hypothetical protein
LIVFTETMRGIAISKKTPSIKANDISQSGLKPGRLFFSMNYRAAALDFCRGWDAPYRRDLPNRYPLAGQRSPARGGSRADNGTGIPDDVKEKIFNPFFTTKPSGEGTGLGLSMSHDIIVKQHAGSIDVATESGVFTEFKIVLPRATQT